MTVWKKIAYGVLATLVVVGAIILLARGAKIQSLRDALLKFKLTFLDKELAAAATEQERLAKDQLAHEKDRQAAAERAADLQQRITEAEHAVLATNSDDRDAAFAAWWASRGTPAGTHGQD